MPHLCAHCGEPEQVHLLEAWSDGSFMLDTCCPGLLDEATEILNEDPKTAAGWLEQLRDSDGYGFRDVIGAPLRRVIDNEAGQLVLDYQLQLAGVKWAQARDFVAVHHRHCKPPRGWKFGRAVYNGLQLIGVVTVGRPVARGYKSKPVLEVNRCCVRTDVPSALVWNACSMLYGWAAREAKKRGYQKIITYLRDDEDGTTLKAAGWYIEARLPARKRGWRKDEPIIGKTRWARVLVDHAKPSSGAVAPVSLANSAPLMKASTASAELDYAD